VQLLCDPKGTEQLRGPQWSREGAQHGQGRTSVLDPSSSRCLRSAIIVVALACTKAAVFWLSIGRHLAAHGCNPGCCSSNMLCHTDDICRVSPACIEAPKVAEGAMIFVQQWLHAPCISHTRIQHHSTGVCSCCKGMFHVVLLLHAGASACTSGGGGASCQPDVRVTTTGETWLTRHCFLTQCRRDALRHLAYLCLATCLHQCHHLHACSPRSAHAVSLSHMQQHHTPPHASL
jgi:hypothetical protein